MRQIVVPSMMLVHDLSTLYTYLQINCPVFASAGPHLLI